MELPLQVDFAVEALILLDVIKIINTTIVIAIAAAVQKQLIMVLQQIQRLIEPTAKRDTIATITITAITTAIAIVVTAYA